MTYEPTQADNQFLVDLTKRAIDAFMDQLKTTPEGRAILALGAPKAHLGAPLAEALGDFFVVTVEGFSEYAASKRT